jgi:hypothetical protein
VEGVLEAASCCERISFEAFSIKALLYLWVCLIYYCEYVVLAFAEFKLTVSAFFF